MSNIVDSLLFRSERVLKELQERKEKIQILKVKEVITVCGCDYNVFIKWIEENISFGKNISHTSFILISPKDLYDWFSYKENQSEDTLFEKDKRELIKSVLLNLYKQDNTYLAFEG